tara:strand:+ start:233 stop:514 length:282 start_codon:yes stop_codon:yes gene_type:complete
MKHERKSYVNQPTELDKKTQERFDKLGKNYSSINFEMSNSITETNVKDKSTVIGSLIVGSRYVELTYSECNRVMEMLLDAQTTVRQKQKLGMF